MNRFDYISFSKSHDQCSPIKVGINNLLGDWFLDDITPKLLLCQEIVITVKESRADHRVTGGYE